jgi:hypothetical protein
MMCFQKKLLSFMGIAAAPKPLLDSFMADGHILFRVKIQHERFMKIVLHAFHKGLEEVVMVMDLC